MPRQISFISAQAVAGTRPMGVREMWNVHVLSIETIKPSSPSPHLATLNLSLLDQLAPRIYVRLVLFYSDGDGSSRSQAQKSHHLKTSLSQTLTHFYPLAGRIHGNTHIECNDSGVDFVEARVEGRLSEFLLSPDIDAVSDFLPCDAGRTRSGREVLLAVQANFFDCGGTVVGVGISHKIADGASFSTFINGWAAVARGDSEMAPPTFDAAAHFRPIEAPGPPEPDDIVAIEENRNVATKRFVFDAPKIAALRAVNGGKEAAAWPTRVEAVSALIWRCMMRARVGEASSRASVALQAVNLRPRMAPPLPKHSFGNILSGALAAANDVEETKSCVLEKQMRDAIERIGADDHIRRLQGAVGLEESYGRFRALGERYKRGYDLCIFSSWCRFPLYEADFGWGRPDWVSQGRNQLRNSTVLMATRSGCEIETWVCLAKDDMVRFEEDEELLSFSSIAAP